MVSCTTPYSYDDLKTYVNGFSDAVNLLGNSPRAVLQLSQILEYESHETRFKKAQMSRLSQQMHFYLMFYFVNTIHSFRVELM